MSSTPKQQDGDGSVAATGSLLPIEQTVMGIAPPPNRGTAAAGPLAPASLILPSSVVASPPAAPPSIEPSNAAPPPSSTLVAAPVIAVSRTPAEPAASAVAVPAPALETAAARDAVLGSTLRIEPSAPAEHGAAAPSAPELAAERTLQSERTALSADYLREARAAALEEVAQRPPAPDPIALASTERAPAAEVSAAVASALANGGDTHRSVAPALEQRPESVPSRIASGSGPVSARGFEPVPVVRAPLAESLSSALGPLGELGGGARNLLPASSRPRPAPARERDGGAGRWLLLAAVALVTVAVVSVGGRLWQRYRAHSARQRPIATVEAGAAIAAAPGAADAPSASRALLANRPAREPGDGRVRVVSATAAAAPAAEPGASASPESQLAATAGRHVLSGNYGEALPLYRQLERGWPENTAYAAMARLLEKKVGSHNDTRTVAPAAAPEGGSGR